MLEVMLDVPSSSSPRRWWHTDAICKRLLEQAYAAGTCFTNRLAGRHTWTQLCIYPNICVLICLEGGYMCRVICKIINLMRWYMQCNKCLPAILQVIDGAQSAQLDKHGCNSLVSWGWHSVQNNISIYIYIYIYCLVWYQDHLSKEHILPGMISGSCIVKTKAYCPARLQDHLSSEKMRLVWF